MLGSKTSYNIDALLEDWNSLVGLADRCRNRGPLCLLLRLLTVECGQFGTMFRGLIDQELPLHRNQRWACLTRRIKVGKRIAAIRERCSHACSVKPGRDEVAPQMITFGFVHRSVEFDQNIAGFDVSVTDVDGAHDPGLKGLHDLVRSLGMILPAAEATISIWPRQAQASPRQKTPAIVTAMPRPNGEGGVSMISSAAEEGDLFAVAAIARAWQRDDIAVPYGVRPADDEAPRSVRLS